MREDAQDRLAAEALIVDVDGFEAFGLLPSLCRRRHHGLCRAAVLRRADAHVSRPRGAPGA
jgi:hypothetical protein